MKRRKDMHRQFANFLDAKGTLLDELNWKLEDMQSLCKELRSQSVKSLQSFEGKLKQMETSMIHLRKLQRKGTSSATNRRLLHEAETDCINKIAKYNGFVHAGAYEEEGTISRLIDVNYFIL